MSGPYDKTCLDIIVRRPYTCYNYYMVGTKQLNPAETERVKTFAATLHNVSDQSLETFRRMFAAKVRKFQNNGVDQAKLDAVEAERRWRFDGTCIKFGCRRKATCKKMCATHYRNTRACLLVPDEPHRQCERDGCVRIKLAHGLCRNHLSMELHRRDAKPGQRECSVEECHRLHSARGYCHRHYGRWTRQQAAS